MNRWLHNLLVKVGVRPRAKIVLSLDSVKKVEEGIDITGGMVIYGEHADLVNLVKHLLNDTTTKPLVAEAMHASIMNDLDKMGDLLGKDLTKKIKDSIKSKETPEA